MKSKKKMTKSAKKVLTQKKKVTKKVATKKEKSSFSREEELDILDAFFF